MKVSIPLAVLLLLPPVADTVGAAPGDPIGPDFQVNTYTTDFQSSPSVAVTSDGSSIVVWVSNSQDGSVLGAFGQRFDSAGAPIGTEFQVNTTTVNAQYPPRVASLANDDFVVVWPNAIPYFDYNVIGRRYASDGQPVSGEFLVNTFTTMAQMEPDVVGLRGGGFVVAWTSYDPTVMSPEQDGSAHGVFAQRFDSAGTAVGTEFQVNSYTVGEQRRASAAGIEDGGFVVHWQSYGQDGDEEGVFGQRFASTGQPNGSEFQVNTATVGGQRFPDVAATTDGGFAAVWSGAGQSFDVNGQKVGGEFSVPPGTFEHIARDGSGFVVVSECASDICGRRFDSAGQAIGADFFVNSYTAGTQNDATVSSGGGRFVVSWRGNDDGFSYGVFARVFESAPSPTPTAAPGGGCAATPLSGCTTAARNKIKIRNTGDPTRSQFNWKWSSGTTAKAEFDNPVTSTPVFDLCVYDDGVLEMTAQIAAGANWKENSRGFKYKDSAGANPSGINKVLLKDGAGNAKILVKGRGALLSPPALPMDQTSSVTVQLVRDGGSACWESVFLPMATKNEDGQFKDKEP